MQHTQVLQTQADPHDRFLQTTLGFARNGMPVSVLSALARCNLDPRQEAARLAALPRAAAEAAISHLIETCGDLDQLALGPADIADVVKRLQDSGK